MSWMGLFKKVRNNPELSPEELDLLKKEVRREVDEFLGETTPEPKDKEHNNAASEGQKQLMLRASRTVQVSQFRVWKTVEAAAEELGREVDEIVAKCTDKTLASKVYPPNHILVHVGQVERWFKHGLVMDNINVRVFDGWLRQADFVVKYDLKAQDLSAWAKQGKIAVFKPAPRLVLLNEAEVLEYATREKKTKKG